MIDGSEGSAGGRRRCWGPKGLHGRCCLREVLVQSWPGSVSIQNDGWFPGFTSSNRLSKESGWTETGGNGDWSSTPSRVIRPKAQYQWRLCQSQAARCVANQLHPKVATVLELARDSFRLFQGSSRARQLPITCSPRESVRWELVSRRVRARQNTHSAEESHGGSCRMAAYQGALALNPAVDGSGKLQRRRIG